MADYTSKTNKQLQADGTSLEGQLVNYLPVSNIYVTDSSLYFVAADTSVYALIAIKV